MRVVGCTTRESSKRGAGALRPCVADGLAGLLDSSNHGSAWANDKILRTNPSGPTGSNPSIHRSGDRAVHLTVFQPPRKTSKQFLLGSGFECSPVKHGGFPGLFLSAETKKLGTIPIAGSNAGAVCGRGACPCRFEPVPEIRKTSRQFLRALTGSNHPPRAQSAGRSASRPGWLLAAALATARLSGKSAQPPEETHDGIAPPWH